MNSPIARHSSAVVRISVTVGLWRYRFVGLEALGHRVPGAEVHHVERAARADVGQRAAREHVEPRRPGREHAAADLVGDLGRRDVDHAGEQPGVGELFHRLAADAGGVEDEAVVVVVEPLGHGLHARRRDAEHRQAERRLVVGVEIAGGCAIIPASACAAFASTCSLMRWMPCTSVTEYIMQMSLGPT